MRSWYGWFKEHSDLAETILVVDDPSDPKKGKLILDYYNKVSHSDGLRKGPRLRARKRKEKRKRKFTLLGLTVCPSGGAQDGSSAKSKNPIAIAGGEPNYEDHPSVRRRSIAASSQAGMCEVVFNPRWESAFFADLQQRH